MGEHQIFSCASLDTVMKGPSLLVVEMELTMPSPAAVIVKITTIPSVVAEGGDWRALVREGGRKAMVYEKR